MANWIRAAHAPDIADGEVVGLKLADKDIALYHVDGQFYATDNICSHAYALLSDGYLDDREIECPLHAGRFNICTGKAQGEPVTENIKTYPVQRDGDDLLVDLG